MNCIITMAGRGGRFREQGIDQPKYEIMVKGHSLFEWSLISLRELIRKEAHFIFVCLKENNSGGFLQSHCKALGVSSWATVEVAQVTDGQATSVLHAEKHLRDGQGPIAIFNIDTHVHPNGFSAAVFSACPSIPCFQAEGNHWSFVKVGADGLALETSEKVRISDRASLGLYTFSSFQQFREAYTKTYSSKTQFVKEKYIAPIYNSLIRQGVPIMVPMVDRKWIAPLGTPEEVAAFRASAHSWPGEEA